MNNPMRAWVQELVEIKAFTDTTNLVRGGQVLEIGCGNGNGARLIDKYFHPKKVYGIDLDPKMIVLANKGNPRKFNFQVGDASKLQFRNNSFDGIFDFGVLHHIPNWKEAVDEAYRVLKQGGQIFIEDFSIETFNISLGKVFHGFLDHPYDSMYKRNDFMRYFESVGFKIVKKEVRRPFGLLEYFILVATKT